MARRRRIRVLLVSDDAFVRGALLHALEDNGFHVLEAPGAKVALNLLRVSLFPLVVLIDHQLRDGDAVSLIHAITSDPGIASRHAYLYVAASPHVLPPSLLRLLQEHHIPIVTHPFDADGLTALIREAVAGIKAD